MGKGQGVTENIINHHLGTMIKEQQQQREEEQEEQEEEQEEGILFLILLGEIHLSTPNLVKILALTRRSLVILFSLSKYFVIYRSVGKRHFRLSLALSQRSEVTINH